MMRAKMKVQFVDQQETCLNLSLVAVGRDGAYPEDGSDENNTFAKWTPSASVSMCVTNPELFGKFKEGDEFYVDFTAAK